MNIRSDPRSICEFILPIATTTGCSTASAETRRNLHKVPVKEQGLAIALEIEKQVRRVIAMQNWAGIMVAHDVSYIPTPRHGFFAEKQKATQRNLVGVATITCSRRCRVTLHSAPISQPGISLLSIDE